LPTLSEPRRDYPFLPSINCFIFSTTPDESLATSSFLKRITLSPNADNAFSRLASSSCCKSWMSPSTSMTSAALSKTPCGLYGVTIKIDDEPFNNLPPAPTAGAVCLRKWTPTLFARRRSPKGKILPKASSRQQSCCGDSPHFQRTKMGGCPKDRGAAR